MNEATSLLVALSAAAQRLPDSASRSLCSCCAATVKAYRLAWREPANNKRLEALHAELARLFRVLCDNGMYTNPVACEDDETKPRIVLPGGDALQEEFRELKTLSIMNRNGVGELPLMYTLLLMCRSLAKPRAAPLPPAFLDDVGDVILLRVPAHLEINLRPFSTELKTRYDVIRALYSMQMLGYLSDMPVEKPTSRRWAETTRLLTNGTCLAISPHVPDQFRLPFDMLQSAFALERYARAGATLVVNPNERTPREVFKLLRSRLKTLAASADRDAPQSKRLLKLGITTMIRFMSYMEPELGRSIYKFLRHGGVVARVRHSQMFRALRTNAERLRFVNFLNTQGEATPKALRGRFQKYFVDRRLIFSRDRRSFELEAPAAAGEKRRRTVMLRMTAN